MKKRTTKPSNNYFYPKKIKPMNFGGNQLTKTGVNVAKMGIGLAFAGLTLGIASKAFNKSFE